MNVIVPHRFDAAIHKGANRRFQPRIVIQPSGELLAMLEIEGAEPLGADIQHPMAEHEPLGVIRAINRAGHPTRASKILTGKTKESVGNRRIVCGVRSLNRRSVVARSDVPRIGRIEVATVNVRRVIVERVEGVGRKLIHVLPIAKCGGLIVEALIRAHVLRLLPILCAQDG